MTSAAMDRPATNRRLLLVDDDKALRQSLAEQLRLVESFDCREAETGRGALDIAAKERFDAVLLDIGLPDMDGRDVCRLLRRAGVSAPIIMLTAADTDADTILGLDSGANDYITKPFRMGVLLARAQGPAAPACPERGRHFRHRALYLPARPQDAARSDRQEEDPPHREGGGSPQTIYPL